MVTTHRQMFSGLAVTLVAALLVILLLASLLSGCAATETYSSKNPAVAGAPELARAAHADVKDGLGEAVQLQAEIKAATPETFAVAKPTIEAHIDDHVKTLDKAEKSSAASEKATIGTVKQLQIAEKKYEDLKAEDSATFWTRVAAYAAMALGTFGLVLSFESPSIRPLAASVFVMGLCAFVVITYIKAIIWGAIITAVIGLIVYALIHPEWRAKVLSLFKKSVTTENPIATTVPVEAI